MNLDQYQTLAIRTKKDGTQDFDLMHSVYGLAGEVGEFADAVKRYQVYGKPFDMANAAEEIGDILWYAAVAAAALGVSLNTIAADNIAKLQKRYPEKYTDLHASLRLDKDADTKD